VGFVNHQPGAVASRHGDEARQVGDIAIHTVMTLDDEKRAIVARTQLAEQTIGGFVVEMGKRRPARPRQCCSLGDTVVDQRIMHDQIVAPEQMPDNSNVRRMSADERDTILAAMEARQRLLQLP
jgi:hypothetical protein